MQVHARCEQTRMPGSGLHFCQGSATRQGMTDERVPAVVDRQRRQPFGTDHSTDSAKAFAKSVSEDSTIAAVSRLAFATQLAPCLSTWN